jgi:hypothetical protein
MCFWRRKKSTSAPKCLPLNSYIPEHTTQKSSSDLIPRPKYDLIETNESANSLSLHCPATADIILRPTFEVSRIVGSRAAVQPIQVLFGSGKSSLLYSTFRKIVSDFLSFAFDLFQWLLQKLKTAGRNLQFQRQVLQKKLQSLFKTSIHSRKRLLLLFDFIK